MYNYIFDKNKITFVDLRWKHFFRRFIVPRCYQFAYSSLTFPSCSRSFCWIFFYDGASRVPKFETVFRVVKDDWK